MSPKKAFTTYLTKLIKGRAEALAQGMKIPVEDLKGLAEGTLQPITLDQAVSLGNLTQTDPKTILQLQLEYQLDEMGVKAPVKPKVSKPRLSVTGKGATFMPQRRPQRGSVVR